MKAMASSMGKYLQETLRCEWCGSKLGAYHFGTKTFWIFMNIIFCNMLGSCLRFVDFEHPTKSWNVEAITINNLCLPWPTDSKRTGNKHCLKCPQLDHSRPHFYVMDSDLWKTCLIMLGIQPFHQHTNLFNDCSMVFTLRFAKLAV